MPRYEEMTFEEYRIKVNDELLFRLITSDETISRLITSNQTLSNVQSNISYRVYTDGTVDFPFVKEVPVAGLTLNEAAKVIESHFKELIPDAAVKLTLANKNFTVIGEAGTGVFPIFTDKLTLFQALSMSGEISYTGDYSRIRIIRETDDGTEVLSFDIRPASIINSRYYYIYPNDIIYVQRNPSSLSRSRSAVAKLSWSSSGFRSRSDDSPTSAQVIS